jgi:protein-disulfide isomerase
MIVFSDFECRFCGSMARETMPLIDAKYVATGRLLVAFKHLPLEPIHQAAARAAAAVECAGRQNAFWDMHDELFLSQHQQFDDRGLLRRAEAIGLDRAPFLRCLDGDGRQRVEDDVRLAKSLGISSTPTILVGAVLADGRVRILRRLSGSKSAAVLGSAIDSVLAGGEMAGAAAGRD